MSKKCFYGTRITMSPLSTHDMSRWDILTCFHCNIIILNEVEIVMMKML
jgi:hypothetical protein